jgi:SHS2 domain-containing protein
MNTPHTQAGFREVAHTADWEIEVWAPDPCALLKQAALSMYSLIQTRLAEEPRLKRTLELPGNDLESLLVGFLSELLYMGEVEGIGFDQFDLRLENEGLIAGLEGAPIEYYAKNIKAVTYHGLSIRETERGLEANLVFDV